MKKKRKLSPLGDYGGNDNDSLVKFCASTKKKLEVLESALGLKTFGTVIEISSKIEGPKWNERSSTGKCTESVPKIEIFHGEVVRDRKCSTKGSKANKSNVLMKSVAACSSNMSGIHKKYGLRPRKNCGNSTINSLKMKTTTNPKTLSATYVKKQCETADVGSRKQCSKVKSVPRTEVKKNRAKEDIGMHVFKFLTSYGTKTWQTGINCHCTIRISRMRKLASLFPVWVWYLPTWCQHEVAMNKGEEVLFNAFMTKNKCGGPLEDCEKFRRIVDGLTYGVGNVPKVANMASFDVMDASICPQNDCEVYVIQFSEFCAMSNNISEFTINAASERQRLAVEMFMDKGNILRSVVLHVILA
ncbi:hypothetical protein ACH5RR_001565 [Cinchona calisaya]|uniref:Uncharacterized protein n=1 Tax=Cinchona calisaya TaxID=153742 RepID=A0ABD3B3V5_9GENT